MFDLLIHDLINPRIFNCVSAVSRGMSSAFPRWAAELTKYTAEFVLFFSRRKLWALAIRLRGPGFKPRPGQKFENECRVRPIKTPLYKTWFPILSNASSLANHHVSGNTRPTLYWSLSHIAHAITENPMTFRKLYISSKNEHKWSSLAIFNV